MSINTRVEKTLNTRPATGSDFDFAWEVYRDAVRPMIEPKLKGKWDDTKEKENFRSIWEPTTVHVILLDGTPMGWGAVTSEKNKVVIKHFYFQEKHRGKGYGTKMLEELLAKWKGEGKEVHVDTVNGSRAASMAYRLGFIRKKEDTLVTSFVRKS